MLVSFVVQGFMLLLIALLGFLPVTTTLPYGIDGALYVVGVWIVEIQQYLWPLQIIFTIFFGVYLPFLFLLLVLKFFMGYRAP